ncbi:hypothetical protein [Massilia sp. IC2-476]|uniref:hypothetical protein n=1 Tax=Massilia sp. IC2-476 TaxID=2887199 RepID=UPI001D11345E|nr:hypothetical protein [Massilia sp. IC2-476]MCC2971795.1 hypothetical protein [Massilia sp. IC2-476]
MMVSSPSSTRSVTAARISFSVKRLNWTPSSSAFFSACAISRGRFAFQPLTVYGCQSMLPKTYKLVVPCRVSASLMTARSSVDHRCVQQLADALFGAVHDHARHGHAGDFEGYAVGAGAAQQGAGVLDQ